ncbi:ribosomal protein L7/L12 [Dictyobacter kobayashii]|uniref:Large ribosomal subunit protein bL12 C-terminal domain-containing protein n=1 Tax=Dictyobacter kobayashii TaxID=2014872 RepID=A0A402AFM6_9CHLR|nr:ribosomal protein L7/L12 [Dictyobacter kobayashii]GCE17917.1 hypothetical protein KDK_17170 [Dictyobacter kobayashii]
MRIFESLKKWGQNPYPEKPSSLSFHEEIVWYLTYKDKIFAIKAYRQHTGVGLKEAKHAVDAIERELKGSYRISDQINTDQINTEELQTMILAGQKILAIKYYREKTGVGLKEAKDAVDWLEQSLRNKSE